MGVAMGVASAGHRVEGTMGLSSERDSEAGPREEEGGVAVGKWREGWGNSLVLKTKTKRTHRIGGNSTEIWWESLSAAFPSSKG